jgi:hypothetical protein
MSTLEAVSDTVSSLGVGVACNFWLAPLIGITPTLGQATVLTFFFAAVGLLRKYLWRRLFNWLHVRGHN